MQPQGELSQSPGHKIQYFWEWFSFKTDKLKEYEPQRRFDSLYLHLVNLSENLKGDSHIIRKSFVYQMLKSILSSLCYIAPLPIIMYSSNTKLYEFGVLRGRSGEVLSVMLEYDVEDSKATLSNVYETTLSNVYETTLSNVYETTLSNVYETTLSNVYETTLSNVYETTLSNVYETTLSNVYETTLSNCI